jgi:2-polyprenyl-3-methyl-5-hydroxy-6-metoxy-1,4-benzoquinol methylase
MFKSAKIHPKMTKSKQLGCPLCQGKCRFRYAMEGHDIWQCQNCGSGQVHPLPGVEFLKAYYSGFSYNLNFSPYLDIEASAKKLFLDFKLDPRGGLKMLDIGGGGGFFSKAFELLGYGESTYLDIDPLSCDFARENLKLKRVFSCDAMDLDKYVTDRFDFIYCRHVVEHLTDPVSFMRNIIRCLSANGIFIVQVPNASSIEYLAYPGSTLKDRVSSILKANNFSRVKVLWTIISGGMLHGIDPPRHLWAITGKGIKSWASSEKITCDVRTYHLGDPAYSPYYRKAGDARAKIHEFIGQKVLAPIHGGTHLVAILGQRDER